MNLKLIDVNAYESFKGVCSNCGRKLKNEYVLSNNKTVGSECIIKLLGDSLEIDEQIKTLSHKLKVIKFILNKCNKVLVSGEVLNNPNNPEFKAYFYVWIYWKDSKHFTDFQYRFNREKLKPFLKYFERNKDIHYILDDWEGREISFNRFIWGIK